MTRGGGLAPVGCQLERRRKLLITPSALLLLFLRPDVFLDLLVVDPKVLAAGCAIAHLPCELEEVLVVMDILALDWILQCRLLDANRLVLSCAPAAFRAYDGPFFSPSHKNH